MEVERLETSTSVKDLAPVLRLLQKYDVFEEMNQRALEGHRKVLVGDALNSVYCFTYLFNTLIYDLQNGRLR